jgi:hypothetical protein
MASNVTRIARAAGMGAQRLAGRLQGLRPRPARRSMSRPWLVVAPAIGGLMAAAATALLWDERRRTAARERAVAAAEQLRKLPERAAKAAGNGRIEGSVDLTPEPESEPPEPVKVKSGRGQGASQS